MDAYEKAPNDSKAMSEGNTLKGHSEDTEFNVTTALAEALIDVNEELKPPVIAWGMVGDLILGTLGNFSLITGKAKSKKSFFLNIAISSAVSGQTICNKIVSYLPISKQNILYFDTEQGKYHVQLALKRICTQTGISEPTNLKVYGLRKFKPSERLEIIEYAINNETNVGLVVIDGIKDLITSINDEEQATMVVSRLLKWTEEKEIHIINVLHQNKSDNNARGHIGTELINKAETVLSITVDDKDKEISIMEAEQTRNKAPEPFAFRINEIGIPEEVEDYQFIKELPSRQRNFLTELTNEFQYELLESVFIRKAERNGVGRPARFETDISYSELIGDIKYLTKDFHNKGIGYNKVKDFITECKHKDFIYQEKARKPYRLNDINIKDY